MTAAPVAPAPRRSSRLPIVVGIVVVIAIVVALLAVMGVLPGTGTASVTPDPAASVPGVIPADSNVVAEGRVVPARSAEIASASGGEVVAVNVAPGDTVAAGDVLLEFDHAAADLQVESAQQALAASEANAARAQAAVDQAQAGVDQARAGVDQAQAGVSQAQGSLSAANGSVNQAIAAWNAAKAARSALPSGTSKAQKRQADAQVSQASAGIAAARGQRSAASAAVTAARASVDTARAGVATARAAVASARAALDAAKADAERAAIAVRQAEAARDQLLLTAPVAGTVISVDPAVGDLVQPGIVLVRVADTSAWQFETTDLSETSIARVQEGSPVTVTVDGLPGEEIAATVESVSGYGQPSQGDIVFRVVAVPTGDVPEGLRWNMTVTMDIGAQAGG
jgi:multidrug resistance efflux pump